MGSTWIMAYRVTIRQDSLISTIIGSCSGEKDLVTSRYLDEVSQDALQLHHLKKIPSTTALPAVAVILIFT